MSAFLAFVVAVAAITTWALHRDIKRAAARRRMCELLEPMARAFEEFAAEIGRAFLPALEQAAAEVQRVMAGFSATTTAQTAENGAGSGPGQPDGGAAVSDTGEGGSSRESGAERTRGSE